MPDKEVLQAVLEAVGATRQPKSERRGDRCNDEECVAPENVVYIILCNCVNIHNGACEDWEFCGQNGPRN